MASRSKAAPGDAQEGSRWINRRPSGREVADWFVANAPVADGLKPERYVSGVTLIPAKEKPRLVTEQGAIIDGPEQLVFTPYVKVDTRIAYFWDLMALHREEWIGVIQPEQLAKLSGAGVANEHLPAGAFRMPVKKADGKFVDFIGFSYQVAIYDRSTVQKVTVATPGSPPGWRRGGEEASTRIVGVPVMVAPAGVKVVPLLSRYGEDQFAVMKAQTGAIGRALGMAGMLVVPGSGVATAEDVQEAVGADGALAGAFDATLEGDVQRGVEQQAPDSLLEHAKTLIQRLQADDPQALAKVAEWAEGRRIKLGELTEQSPALRGVVRRLEEAAA